MFSSTCKTKPKYGYWQRNYWSLQINLYFRLYAAQYSIVISSRCRKVGWKCLWTHGFTDFALFCRLILVCSFKHMIGIIVACRQMSIKCHINCITVHETITKHTEHGGFKLYLDLMYIKGIRSMSLLHVIVAFL